MNRRWVFCVVGVYLQVCVCMCVVLYIVFSYTLFSYVHITSFYFLHMNQQDVPVWYVASDRCMCPNYYFLFRTIHHQLPLCLGNQYWCCVRTVGDDGAKGEICKTVESVKVLSVYRSFQNDKIKVMVSNKCYDYCEYISIMNLQSTA